jgi:hypothetical protein
VALPVERDGVALLRRARDSALGNGGTRDGGGEAWMEKPTVDEAGSKGLEVEAVSVSQDSKDLLRIGGVDAGTGASAAGNDAVDKI